MMDNPFPQECPLSFLRFDPIWLCTYGVTTVRFFGGHAELVLKKGPLGWSVCLTDSYIPCGDIEKRIFNLGTVEPPFANAS